MGFHNDKGPSDIVMKNGIPVRVRVGGRVATKHWTEVSLGHSLTTDRRHGKPES